MGPLHTPLGEYFVCSRALELLGTPQEPRQVHIPALSRLCPAGEGRQAHAEEKTMGSSITQETQEEQDGVKGDVILGGSTPRALLTRCSGDRAGWGGHRISR